MNRLMRILSGFKNKRIILLGDVMLDKYIWGDVKRISPEAPVQVVHVKRESFVGGGAANVAVNINALGGEVDLIGLVGRDAARRLLIGLLEKKGVVTKGMITHATKPTIQKVRVIAHNQQLLRVDYEDNDYISEEEEMRIARYLEREIPRSDTVVVSDYAKGIVTKNIMTQLIDICKGNSKALIVDPKPKHFSWYKGTSIITPNHKEALEILNLESGKINEVGKKLKDISQSNLLITRGELGMSLFSLDGMIRHIPTVAREVYDVTGAGDTVVATVALAMASGASLEEAAVLANLAAGITVGKIGTSAVTVEEIVKSYEQIRIP